MSARLHLVRRGSALSLATAGLAAVVVGGGVAVAAGAVGVGDEIVACYDLHNGGLRAVGSPDACRTSEGVLTWARSASGGPALADQTCPDGQFVRGVSGGALVCGDMGATPPPVEPEPLPERVVVNEVAYGSADGTGRFVELLNTGQGPVDLADYSALWVEELRQAVSSIPALPAQVLAPGGRFVITSDPDLPTDGAPKVVVPTDALADTVAGDGLTVGLYHRRDGRVDVLGFGLDADPYSEFQDGRAATPRYEGQRVPRFQPPAGGSVARVPDGVDTDRSAHDLSAVDVPTPGAANSAR